jgi:hypothetical protein
MKRIALQSVLAVLPLGLAGVLVYGTPSAHMPQSATPALVSQPSDWVPFSADHERISDTGEVFVGRYYQASDGSTRAENGPTLEKINRVLIKHIPTATFYTWRLESGWTQQPMQLPPNGWHPRPTVASLFKDATETIDGFRLLKRELDDRTVFVAPELNLFPVLERKIKCSPGVASCGFRYFNIRIGEPPSELFQPDPNATITRLTQPGGIVKTR